MTREQWLQDMVVGLRQLFRSVDAPLPDKILIGNVMMYMDGERRMAIGLCTGEWIFISPKLNDAVDVGATLTHELVHASVGCKHGHRTPFRRLALKVGLEGPMRTTFAGAKLKSYLEAVTKEIGPLPQIKNTRLVEMDLEVAASVIASRHVNSRVPAQPDYPRWFYHRVTRERRIVHNDGEAAALGPMWWEWIKNRGRYS